MRLFAALREIAGDRELDVDGATVEDVVTTLTDKFGERFGALIRSGSVVVNGERAPFDTALSGDEQVALLPPVSGGEESVPLRRPERVLMIVNPVARGLPDVFIIPEQEMYGEFFDIPQPDELVFISSFTGGEVFRSGCAFHRGQGRIFYFSPGHETHPVYHQPEIRRVIANAVQWVGIGPLPAYPTLTHGVHSPGGWYAAPAGPVPS